MASPDFCTCEDTQDLADEMASWRQALHRQPELAFEEHQTAAFVAGKLQDWGYVVSEEVGGTGVVGTLRNGSGTRRIGIRADMDALPIHEATGLPYASVAPGKMHACGHDGHTAMLLGAARHLARTRRFSGTIHLIFQPAEERGANGGAKAMMDDGLFDRFPCDAVFRMHNHPGLREGAFLFRDGAFMAASDTVRIRVKGFGGHAARPHMTTDAVMVASAIVMTLQTVVSRSIDPTEPAVVTVGSLVAGDAPNVIAGEALLQLSVRSFSTAVRRQLQERIEGLVRAQAASFGASVDIDYIQGYPVLVNSTAETRLASEVARELVGVENVDPHAPLQMGSEDFAYLLEARPGAFMRIGNGVGALARPLHNNAYNFNDANLTVGAAYWTRLAERYLASA